MKKRYGIDTITIYPPVPGSYPDIACDKREDGFVCLGRIVPEKGVDRVIEIVRQSRERGHNVHLHIIGETDSDDPYCGKIFELSKKYNDWLFLVGGVYGEEKYKVLSMHKYGIHGRRNEPFGIAVAEMVKAGCITFVPDDGGQVEIVNHPQLTYSDIADAVDKIDTVLSDRNIKVELLKHLSKQAEMFSTERFMTEVRELVELFLEDHAGN